MEATELGAGTGDRVASQLARVSRLYAALSHVNQAIVKAQTREVLFHEVCRALGEHGDFRLAWIGWHVPETSQIVPVASWGDGAEYLLSLEIFSDDRPEGRGPTGTAVREKRPLVSNDLLDDPRSLPWRAELDRRGFRAAAVIPLREGNVVRGALSVYAGERDYFHAREIALLQDAANDVTFALANLGSESARREAEETVRHERDFSDAVLRSLPGILYLYDAGGRFIRWNQNFEVVTGYSSAEIAGMRPLDFCEPSARALMTSRIEETFATGQSSIQAGLLAKDGTVMPYYFTGNRTVIDGQPCLVGVGIDVSERQRAESAQRATEARYRTLFDYAPDGIVVADPRGRYVDANTSICRMLGYSREELVGKTAAALVTQDDLVEIEPALSELLAAEDHRREWTFRRKDGSNVSADVIATLMPDGNLLALIRDNSARKQSERALRELNETLERRVTERTEELQVALVRAESADRLKSAFLATMSHELRTPLNSIIGFSGIILQGMAGPLTPEQTKQLGMVRGSARHLLELINDVLDISKIEAGQLEVHTASFEVRTSIERVLGMVGPLAQAKNLAVRAQISDSIGTVVGDRRRVEQILVNVMNNAVKFTERGEITLTADKVAGTIAIRIHDTGIGIAPQDLSTLFQPFRQLEAGMTRSHDGTGLGLAICRRLALLMGGQIDVVSELGRGSTFTLTLPDGRGPG